MARPPRIEYDGAWYHVMNRGIGKRNIFQGSGDQQEFLRLLQDIREIWNIEVHAYSLVDNHYHLLLHTPNSHLSKAMRHLGGEYTRYHNLKNKTDGQLFHGRFKSMLIEKETYLLALIRYIHMNPVRAKICSKPEQHPWTSHVAYLKKSKRPPFLVTETVLRNFDNNESLALNNFHTHVLSDTTPALVKIIEAKRRVSVLGSSSFRDQVKVTKKSNRNLIDPRRIMGHVANEPKSIAMELLRKVNGMTHSEIARIMKSNPQAVSKQLQRLKIKKKQDAALTERLITYKNILLSNVQP